LAYVLDSILKLLHPTVPLITAELREKHGEIAPPRDLYSDVQPSQYIINATWPHLQKDSSDPELDTTMDTLQDIIRAVRTVRNETGAGCWRKATVSFSL
ncbi:MAG: hypothetical protein DSY80_08915, partial [Desulfocapsa sp.]